MEIVKGNLNNFLINRYAYHKFYYILYIYLRLLVSDNTQKMYFRKISIKRVNVTRKYAYQKKKKNIISTIVYEFLIATFKVILPRI